MYWEHRHEENNLSFIREDEQLTVESPLNRKCTDEYMIPVCHIATKEKEVGSLRKGGRLNLAWGMVELEKVSFPGMWLKMW